MDGKQLRRLRVAKTPAEIAEAREKLGRGDCPRRYCWYWHSLVFSWEMKPEEGCCVADEHVGDLNLKRNGMDVKPWRRCRRATGNPNDADLYESRSPDLIADGWQADYFDMIGKAGRQRRFQRRQSGERRHEGKRETED